MRNGKIVQQKKIERRQGRTVGKFSAGANVQICAEQVCL